jgi:hypothetical protein
MTSPDHALRGALHTPNLLSARTAPAAGVWVVGGGGTLGSAVLAACLAQGHFARVLAVVGEPLASALRGFEPVQLAALLDADRSPGPQTQAAVIVLERARHSNGRDDAFVQPQPADLLPLAGALHRAGVRSLVVVVPHAPALMPQALAHGLASLDEAALAALGFSQLVLLRAARPRSAPAPVASTLLGRAAALWLQQLALMVPAGQQPLRVAVLAQAVALLLRLLPLAPPGTRVLPPSVLWPLAQHSAGLHHALQGWLQNPGGAATHADAKNPPP